MDTFQTAVSELAELDQKIAALAKRRDQVRLFVNTGMSLYPQESEATHAAVVGHPDPAAREAGVTTKAAIVDAARDILLRQSSVHTRDLVPLLEQRGIEIAGQNKNNAVSVVLSKSGQFEGSRKHGWTIRSPHKEKPPRGVDAPAGAV